MASPIASPALERDPLNLEPKDFGAKLDQITKHHNNLMKLAAQVYSLGKTQRLQYPNGKTVGRKELRALSSQLNKEIKSLKKNYVAHGKRKKRTRKEGTTAGFKNPIVVSDNMKNFFASANLGPSDPRNPASAPLAQQLAVGTNGVTTRAIMTPLFNIYAHVNNMQQDPENKQFLTSTPEMDQYFQQTYANLAAKPQTYQKNRETGQPDLTKPIPKFDPKHFRYASIQSIVAENAIKKDQLPAEYVALLADPATAARLAQEQALVTGVNNYYGWKRSKSKKTLEQWVADKEARKARK